MVQRLKTADVEGPGLNKVTGRASGSEIDRRSDEALFSYKPGDTITLQRNPFLWHDGPGVLSLTSSGVKVSGHGQFLDILTIKKIQPIAEAKSLIIESAGDVKLQSLSRQGRYHNTLTLGSGILESRGSHFLVRNPQDNVLFRSDPSEVVVATDNLRISSKVESPTKRISVHGEEEVSMIARAGDTLVTSLQDIHLHTRKGQIVVDCSRLEIKDLDVADPSVRSTDMRVYQLCSCDDGMLFLTPSERHCRASTDLCSSLTTPPSA
ncbi:hypothetical protein V5799_023773 [Amblyomma americanum]|uniref:Uncharacterized protein n=1 Tax=Amblyomma americanum TaxID=6943 RepID=A0AAQ4FGK7_AMBAM